MWCEFTCNPNHDNFLKFNNYTYETPDRATHPYEMTVLTFSVDENFACTMF